MMYIQSAKNNIGPFYIYSQTELVEWYFLEAGFLIAFNSQLFTAVRLLHRNVKVIYADYGSL